MKYQITVAFCLVVFVATGSVLTSPVSGHSPADQRNLATPKPFVKPTGVNREAYKAFQKRILRDGKLPAGLAFRNTVRSLYGPPKVYSVHNGVVTEQVLQGGIPSDGFVTSEPILFREDKDDTVQGEFLWTLVINAADPTGIRLKVYKNDQIEFVEGSGKASFDEPDGHWVPSLVRAIPVVGDIARRLEDAGKEAEIIGQELFGTSSRFKKERDIFGIEPKSGLKARQEGGILISLPGDVKHISGEDKNEWIKENGVRTNENRPDAIQYGFFPIEGDKEHNKRIVQSDGDLHILAWDHKHEDNKGFYTVALRIKRAEKGKEQANKRYLQ